MVVSTSDLQFFIRREKAPDLLERLGRYDQLAGSSTRGIHRDLHLCESMTIGRHHSHVIGTKLPQNTVQDRPAFLSRYSKGSMRDQLLKVTRSYSPAILETDR